MNMHVKPAAKLKAGDMVKVLHTDYPDEIPVGSVTTVVAVDPDGDADLNAIHGQDNNNGDGWFFFSGEFEALPAAKPLKAGEAKAGDRVKCINAYAGSGFTVGSTYTVSEITYDRLHVVADDDGEPSGWTIDRFELVDAPKFKVGDKVHIAFVEPDFVARQYALGAVAVVSAINSAGNNDDQNHYNLAGDDGFYYTERELDHAPAESKFKVGDRIVVTIAWRPDITDGKAYAGEADRFVIHSETAYDGYDWNVKLDAPSDHCHDCCGVFTKDVGRWAVEADLEMVLFVGRLNRGPFGLPIFTGLDLAQPSPAIVCAMKDDQPQPATRPFVHASVEDANTEAERLAGKMKGTKFGVYELVGTRWIAAPVVYAHEWQRFAARGDKVKAIIELRRVTDISLMSARDAVENWLLYN